jgi:hypothetical protein
MRRIAAMFASCAIGVAGIAGCATMDPGAVYTTEQKIAACAGMILGGAALGAIIGNNVGGGDAGSGAAVGAALGAGTCAVWLAYNNSADQARLRDVQLAAVKSGTRQTQSWTSEEDGTQRRVTVTPSTETQVAVPQANGTAENRSCKNVKTEAEAGGGSDSFTELYCLNPVTLEWDKTQTG